MTPYFSTVRFSRACVLLLAASSLLISACQGGRNDSASRSVDTPTPEAPSPTPEAAPQLPPPAANLLGCEPLDPAHCLLPFPSNHFTREAAAGSVQSTDAGGTGLQLNFNALQMPRNIIGKPILPAEWNRNDGFSPGTMLITYVPGLAANDNGTIPGLVSLDRLGDYLKPDAKVVVINADTGERHPIWAEIDLNAGFFQPSTALGQPIPYLDGRDPMPALLIRPARNFEEGTRYIALLRHLSDAQGQDIPASDSFAACRDQGAEAAPRCAQLESAVFSALPDDIAREELYLAWDFTIASQQSLTARLLHLRDDAFASLGETMDKLPGEDGYQMGAAPSFTIDTVTENPREGIARRIEGHIEIPSYVIPIDPSPLEAMRENLASTFQMLPDVLSPLYDICRDIVPLSQPCLVFRPAEAIRFASTLSLPPNRFFYRPSDGPHPLYGDSLPDRLTATASMTKPFICNVPASASADNLMRPSVYGHGLLGSRSEVNSSHVTNMGALHNMMFCAMDWFGFSEGDLANILTMLLDVTNFPTLTDAAQQGMLNKMFLARAMVHPDGFSSHQAFQDDQGHSLIDTREAFYDGNSQGGIMGGPVVAISRDVNRGVLGVPGMNYSTLLRRSVDFDLYSIPLYAAYPDDLDRSLVLALIEMLWERAENNGYAHHMNTANSDNTPLPGSPDNQLLLHVGFSDHQVTMWSADVMARTLHAPLDRAMLDRNPQESQPEGQDRHPDIEEYFGFYDLAQEQGARFENGAYSGSVLSIWDEPWDAVEPETRCLDDSTVAAPLGNIPPRDSGDDPHECVRREPGARCQKSHFLHRNGQVLDVSAIRSDAACPPLPN